MRFLEKLLGQRRIEDPFFGSILFFKGRSQEQGYWEGRRHFSPLGRDIEVFLDAPGVGPGGFHRGFFLEFEKRYPGLIQQIRGRLRTEGLPADGLEISSLSIPSAEDQECEIGFTVPGNVSVFVRVRSWEVVGANAE